MRTRRRHHATIRVVDSVEDLAAASCAAALDFDAAAAAKALGARGTAAVNSLRFVGKMTGSKYKTASELMERAARKHPDGCVFHLPWRNG